MKAIHKIYTTICLLLVCVSAGYAATPTSSGYVPVTSGKIYYERYGKGDPILVLHGGPGLDQSYLKPQLLQLAKGHEVIFYDQRGSGKSLDTVIDRSVINFVQFTDDVEAVRKALKLDKIILFGHSWGGVLAMNYAIKYPQHISRMILADSTPADFAGIMAAAAEVDKRITPIKDQIEPLNNYDELKKLSSEQINALYRKAFSVYMNNPHDVKNLSLNMSVESALSGFEVQELIKQDMFINLIPQLQQLNIATTVIIGEQDIVPMWTAEAIVNAIPNAKLVKIAECGHFPYIEKPEEFFAALDLAASAIR